MTHRDVPHQHRHFARAMRSDASWADSRLSQVLRAQQLGGFKFRRRVPLDGYILDFVCFEVRLIIEVDGHQHADSERDARRDAWFRDRVARGGLGWDSAHDTVPLTNKI